jgi:PPOX class probable FMN-dependent enzyme
VQLRLESPDQPDVIALIADLDAYQDTLYPPESRHALDLNSLKQANVLFAVARDAAGAAVGCGAIVLEDDAGEGELKRMYVKPSARGHGVARRLLSLLEARAQAHGCCTLRLETGPSQPEALALYARFGYARRGPFGGYRDDPLSVFMEKPLPAGRGEHTVATLPELLTLYPEPKERSLKKQLSALEVHSRRFIELSPFFVIATAGARGMPDASPRGGAPGFVKVLDDRTLLIPDSRGNNRLDTMRNIIETGKVGLVFMVPGVDETLRVNGRAWLSREPAHLALFSGEQNPPRLAVCVSADEVYLHCAKAFMRSQLWSASAQVQRSALPTIAEMISSQTGTAGPLETQERMVERYQADL